MQAHSVGMHVNRHDVAEALKSVLGDKLKNTYYKSETTLPYKADISKENGYIMGGNASNISTEYGLKFHIDWVRGQKTGFFVDQRENRSLLEKYAKGRKLLNMFCYTGGFSIYALRGGAEVVHSVDSSAKAIDLTNANVAINFPDDTRHAAFAEDAFDYLERMGSNYDLIILDPPGICQAPRLAAQRPHRLPTPQRKGAREDSAGRHIVHILLFAGGEQGEFPHRRVHCRSYGKTQRAHSAPAHPTRRPPREYISPRGRIPERLGALCGIKRWTLAYVSCKEKRINNIIINKNRAKKEVQKFC